MSLEVKPVNIFRRSRENPILQPVTEDAWQSEAVFNPCPVVSGKTVHLLYRAVSSPQVISGVEMGVSSIGYTQSTDGISFGERRQFIKPEFDWEKYGCEDPRVTKLGGKYYIFYTALSTCPFCAEGIRIGMAITRDFKTIDEKHPVTPFNSKAMALFPTRIGGKIAAVLTANTDNPPSKIGIALFDEEKQIWSHEYWEGWYTFLNDHVIPLQRTNLDQVEVGAPPIKTQFGWLLIYSYIQDYFSGRPVFGIEVALLDLDDPRKIIASTKKSLMVPQEVYEKYGRVPNVIFPSGAFVKGEQLYLYYGATDTTCAVAAAKLGAVIEELLLPEVNKMKLVRFPGNPVIQPEPNHSWEAKAVYNTAALYTGDKVHLLYRAQAEDNTSVLGYAASKDGFIFDEKLDQPVYVPREEFEKRRSPDVGSGCEDPRITRIGNDLFMCYTAWDGWSEPRVALTSITVEDFLARRWNWATPVIISPPGIMDKNAAIFPRKFGNKFAILHRPGVSIWLDMVDDLSTLGNGNWIKGSVIMSPIQEELPAAKIGIAAPPIETEYGWLLIYHVVAQKDGRRIYYLSAALLDSELPTRVIARRKTPLLEPEMPYEREGQVPNVVFSCGAVVINGRLFVYYGGADSVIGVATIELTRLLEGLMVQSGIGTK